MILDYLLDVEGSRNAKISLRLSSQSIRNKTLTKSLNNERDRGPLLDFKTSKVFYGPQTI